MFFESAEPAPYIKQFATATRSWPCRSRAVRYATSRPGSDPQVSPNGRYLAFISLIPAGQAGEAPYLVPPVGIDVATLGPDGAVSSVRTLAPGPAQLNQGASDLSWSSDSSELSFDLLDSTTNVTRSWNMPIDGTVTTLTEARRIPLDQAGLTWNGYWGTNRSGTPVELGVLSPASGGQEVVTIDPATGWVVNRLFNVPAAICTAAPHAENTGCSSDFSNEVIGDAAGTSVLVAGATPLVDGSPTTLGQTFLYRWDLGDGAPTRVASQILVASWSN